MQDQPTVPYGYCQCGCGGKTAIADRTSRKSRFKKGEPRPFISGHAYSAAGPDYIVDSNGCWVWQRYINDAGYGIQYLNGNRFRAHRFYYERHKDQIPEGLTLDHLCRNRACVNPAHLEPVTIAENSRRGAATILTSADVRLVKSSPMPTSDLADLLGVSIATVGDIRRGRRWSDV